MNRTWNVASEVFRREYDFSTRWDIRVGSSRSFDQNMLGSLYLAQQIQPTHIVGAPFGIPNCLAFNNKGNLVSITYLHGDFEIYDWAKNEFKYRVKTMEEYLPFNMQFTNSDGNGFEILTTNGDGQIRHLQISPTGKETSTCIYENGAVHTSLTKVPRKPHEFVGVTRSSNIFFIDLRCSEPLLLSDACVFNEIGGNLHIDSVAHHPSTTEICVGGCDAFVRVFDKRNLGQCVRKMFPKHLEHESDVKIMECFYNYDGSEILANYEKRGTYWFDNHSYIPGDYLGCYGADYELHYKARFFGPKSEFIIRTEYDSLSIYHKETGKRIKCEPDKPDSDPYQDRKKHKRRHISLETHPFLPVIATRSLMRSIIFWSAFNDYNYLLEMEYRIY